MAAEFKIREYRHPRKQIVDEVGLKSGFKVLDYGCGPGGYVLSVSEAIGSSGKLYALDALPPLLKWLEKSFQKTSLKTWKLYYRTALLVSRMKIERCPAL
jgi:ubiquinone/menaquinone biosynthesis C-methylase UbiE